MGKNKVGEFNREIFSIRDVLLSTGELVHEAVITYNGKSFYESSPLGSTVGLKETQSRVFSYNEGLKVLNSFSDILNLSQNDFDSILKDNFDSQTTTAFSLAYFKFLAHHKDYDSERLYQYLNEVYKIKPSSPKIICNLLNGSKHAHNNLAFCEFMIIPKGKNIEESTRIASEVYLDLERVIKRELGSKNLFLGREGGFAPMIDGVSEAVKLLTQAIELRNNNRCEIAIDVAANSFCTEKEEGFIYTVDKIEYTTTQFIDYYIKLIKQFPLISYLEDPFHESDTLGWQKLFDSIGSSTLIVGDDLTVSKTKHAHEHISHINACILKINQAGDLSELIKTLEYCKEKGIHAIISQRSGETDSNLLAHLAVGLGAEYMKAGAPARERIVKYNELRRIEDLI